MTFWSLRSAGSTVRQAAAAVGVSDGTGWNWVNERGGVRPRATPPPSGHYLSIIEREFISDYRRDGWTMTAIAKALGRAVSTISRELKTYTNSRGRYLPASADRKAKAAKLRPKISKLEASPQLRLEVQRRLKLQHSPEQISHTLKLEFPDQPEMHVSHETIYQALFVQTKGGLNKDLAKHLRTGRPRRRGHKRTQERRSRIPDMVNISERPGEVEDRKVPGHWEGDLIIGKDGKSAIGTLVERTSRLILLLHLPLDHKAPTVADAMAAKIMELPAVLRRSITWDQGREMSEHARFNVETGVQVYFCDPHSPWQRGSNENANKLLRQYFPKGTDLSVHSSEWLDEVADRLNTRPRKTLGWKTPLQIFTDIVEEYNESLVATTD
ncbi:IS30 family transposase [Rhodococcoides kyotonense]|nr:IS30 family transposase [Rhodococcus kyotonensis]